MLLQTLPSKAVYSSHLWLAFGSCVASMQSEIAARVAGTSPLCCGLGEPKSAPQPGLQGANFSGLGCAVGCKLDLDNLQAVQAGLLGILELE